MNEYNIAKAKSELKDIHFIDILQKAPLHKKYHVFFYLFDSVINKHMPITEKKRKKLIQTEY